MSLKVIRLGHGGFVDSEPSGISRCGSEDDDERCVGTFIKGTTVYLHATEAGGRFVGFSNCDEIEGDLEPISDQPDVSIVLTEPRVVCARFDPAEVTLPSLKVQLVVTGGGTVEATDQNHNLVASCDGRSGPCQATVAPGTVLTLLPRAGAEQYFTGWAAGCQSLPLGGGQATVTSDFTCEAYFTNFGTGRDPFSLQLTVQATSGPNLGFAGDGRGQVTATVPARETWSCDNTTTATPYNMCSHQLFSGDLVLLHAEPAPGSKFVAWECDFRDSVGDGANDRLYHGGAAEPDVSILIGSTKNRSCSAKFTTDDILDVYYGPDNLWKVSHAGGTTLTPLQCDIFSYFCRGVFPRGAQAVLLAEPPAIFESDVGWYDFSQYGSWAGTPNTVCDYDSPGFVVGDPNWPRCYYTLTGDSKLAVTNHVY